VSDTTVRPTVLVVDDESGILQTLEILLRSEGFTPCLLYTSPSPRD